MSSGERFSGYGAKFGYATSQVMSLAQVQGWELDANITSTPFVPSGGTTPTAVITSRVRPEFRLRTQDISTVLAVVDINTGKCFNEASTFWIQERADCSTFLTTATQPGRTTANGFMFVESITAEADSEDGAMMTLRYIPLKASGSDVVVSITNSDPDTDGPTPAFTSAYFLASPYHTAGEWKGVQSVTFNTGIQVQPAPASPGAYDSLLSIVRYEPEITIRSMKVDDFDSFQIGGNPVTTSWALYFQKVDTTNAVGDGRTAVASSVHTKISGAAGKIEVRNLSFDGNDDMGVEVVIRPTGAIAAVTNSAIP